jgi:hypothetical protein
MGPVTPGTTASSPESVLAKGHRPHPGPYEPRPLGRAYSPQELHAAYGIPYQTVHSASQTIALVDAYGYPSAEADLAVYDAEWGLPSCTRHDGCLRIVNSHGRSWPLPPREGGWDGEQALDLDMAHAVCTDCHILLVETPNEDPATMAHAEDTAARLGATEISNSYGYRERRSLRRLTRAYDHPGVVITASSGDAGYLGWQESALSHWKEGEAAEWPSSSPYVVSTGGTSLWPSEDGSFSSRTWTGSGSGCSSLYEAPPWQRRLADFPRACHGRRLTADVSTDADPDTGVAVYDSIWDGEGGSATGWSMYGGTSASAPTVAAMYALAGGARGLSHPAQALYDHLGDASALTPVTDGSNTSSCELVRHRCLSVREAPGSFDLTRDGEGILGHSGPGYSAPTGVGEPHGLSAFVPLGQAGDLPPTPVGYVTLLGPERLAGWHEAHPILGVPLEAASSWVAEGGAAISYAYEWLRCEPATAHSATSGHGAYDCQVVPGATSASYTPGEADRNAFLQAIVTASDQWGSTSIQTPMTGYAYERP